MIRGQILFWKLADNPEMYHKKDERKRTNGELQPSKPAMVPGAICLKPILTVDRSHIAFDFQRSCVIVVL